jgi:tryptophan synthase alpha chain
MNRIELLFKQLQHDNKKALATFVTAGDPNIAATRKLVTKMVVAGADIIELGIPYSDPIAEGSVIQAANSRAMKNGINLNKVFELVSDLRTNGIDSPILFLLYYNVIFKFGSEKFLSLCNKHGIDGLIIPDLPFEEQEEIRPLCDKYNIILTCMVSPVSEERIGKIVKNARGFLYCVSSLGVTGVRSEFKTDFSSFMSKIEKHSALPRLIGFGVSTPSQAAELKECSSGVIVGSAIVRIISESKNEDEAVLRVGTFVKELRSALN